jgi:hypothetical protein
LAFNLQYSARAISTGLLSILFSLLSPRIRFSFRFQKTNALPSLIINQQSTIFNPQSPHSFLIRFFSNIECRVTNTEYLFPAP